MRDQLAVAGGAEGENVDSLIVGLGIAAPFVQEGHGHGSVGRQRPQDARLPGQLPGIADGPGCSLVSLLSACSQSASSRVRTGAGPLCLGFGAAAVYNPRLAIASTSIDVRHCVC